MLTQLNTKMACRPGTTNTQERLRLHFRGACSTTPVASLPTFRCIYFWPRTAIARDVLAPFPTLLIKFPQLVKPGITLAKPAPLLATSSTVGVRVLRPTKPDESGEPTHAALGSAECGPQDTTTNPIADLGEQE